jgi:hypothetical protein
MPGPACMPGGASRIAPVAVRDVLKGQDDHPRTVGLPLQDLPLLERLKAAGTDAGTRVYASRVAPIDMDDPSELPCILTDRPRRRP